MNAPLIEEEAARWLMRRDEPGWSADDQAELEDWLERSMGHKAAFWRLEHGWEAAGRLAAIGGGGKWTGLRRPGRRLAWLAIAASLLLAIGLAGLGLRTPSGEDAVPSQQFATGIGEQRKVLLADGSRVEINTRTRLRAAITPAARDLWLDDGEAYFEVTHDPDRPFVVHAGARTVTVLGTRFSVRRSGDRVQVAVAEGRVRIDQPSSNERSTTITRGDLAVADGPSLLVAQNAPQRVEGNLSWRRGRLTFDQSTLGEAAAEFNRYNRRQIHVTDAEAANMRIGGTFEAGNVEAFGRLLRDAYGLDVTISPDEIRISS